MEFKATDVYSKFRLYNVQYRIRKLCGEERKNANFKIKLNNLSKKYDPQWKHIFRNIRHSHLFYEVKACSRRFTLFVIKTRIVFFMEEITVVLWTLCLMKLEMHHLQTQTQVKSSWWLNRASCSTVCKKTNKFSRK
jgi:hypothetical protein